jgi:hypothetical protein
MMDRNRQAHYALRVNGLLLQLLLQQNTAFILYFMTELRCTSLDMKRHIGNDSE